MPTLYIRKGSRTRTLEGPHARKVFTDRFEPDGWKEYEMPDPYDAAADVRAESRAERQKKEETKTADGGDAQKAS